MKTLSLGIVCLFIASTLSSVNGSHEFDPDLAAHAERHLRDRVGDDLLEFYFEFNPEASKVLDEREGLTGFVWRFHVPEKPFVDVEVGVVVNSSGELAYPIRFPDCANTPSECDFNIDEAEALRLGREAGYGEGYKPWVKAFGWRDRSNSFVWSIDYQDLSRSGLRGPSVHVDANSGDVIVVGSWSITD